MLFNISFCCCWLFNKHTSAVQRTLVWVSSKRLVTEPNPMGQWEGGRCVSLRAWTANWSWNFLTHSPNQASSWQLWSWLCSADFYYVPHCSAHTDLEMLHCLQSTVGITVAVLHSLGPFFYGINSACGLKLNTKAALTSKRRTPFSLSDLQWEPISLSRHGSRCDCVWCALVCWVKLRFP